jgi:hypothetical protein
MAGKVFPGWFPGGLPGEEMQLCGIARAENLDPYVLMWKVRRTGQAGRFRGPAWCGSVRRA